MKPVLLNPIPDEILAYFHECARYQQDPFADEFDTVVSEKRSQVSEDRNSRIVDATMEGDRRQRRKRGLRDASGVHSAKIVNLQEEPSPEPKPITETPKPVQLVSDGTYTIVSHNEQYRTLRVRTQREDASFAPGKQIISFLSGADNENSYTSFAILNPDGSLVLWKKFRNSESADSLKAAVSALLGDPKSAGLAYAMKSGNCYRCGRKLTVPSSLHQGLGPECAKKA